MAIRGAADRETLTVARHEGRWAVERANLASLHEGQKLSYELEKDPRNGKTSAGQLQSA